MSDRSVFLLAFLFGCLAAAPRGAQAAGQWCNNEDVVHRATLTLRAATVGGQPVNPRPSGVYDVTSSAYEPNVISAHLFCATCTGGTVSRERLERAP